MFRLPGLDKDQRVLKSTILARIVYGLHFELMFVPIGIDQARAVCI
jgi:hypothetical protein